MKRTNLSHIDQGLTFARLRTDFNLSELEISKLCGKSIAYISQHINLLDAGDQVIAAVQNKEVSFSVARELVQCKNEDDKNNLLNYAIGGGSTVETVRNWVQTANSDRSRSVQEIVTTKYEKPSVIPQQQTFICKSCEEPTIISEMMVVRLCPECDHLIFSEIRAAKEAQQLETAK